MKNTITATDSSQQITTLVLNTWTSRNTAVSSFFSKYPEAAYLTEVAPGRNRATYLFAHLIATNDALLPLLGFGERLFPELAAFSGSPDKSFATLPDMDELKKKWDTINLRLSDHFEKMSTEDWMSRHTAVSEQDFAKEPHRNKLNVLLGRTNHQSYHLGQLNLLTVKETTA